MNYWLHPQAIEDLRQAADYYRDNAGVEHLRRRPGFGSRRT